MVIHANLYFVSIASNLSQNFVNNGLFVDFDVPNPSTFVFMHTTVAEVDMVIRGLKNKGTGVADLSPATLKNNKEIFSPHLSFLYNYSIEKETFPNLLKIACVIPGYKAGPRDLIDNYRPISNLPIVSKIFEKLTLLRLLSFVNRFKLLSDSQYGFRQGRSITQAAIRLTAFIPQTLRYRAYCACFFLDLRKAFDTVDHEILLKKLYNDGFRGPVHKYLQSYLSNRRQYVRVGDFKSEELVITKGVPQGFLLGPLLFCLYINDIVQAVSEEVVLFADDAAFLLSASSLPLLYSKIQKLFSDLSNYLKVNKLIPNLKKSKLMFFSRSHVKFQKLQFDNDEIEWVNEFKYLGLTLTSSMCFGPHIDKICSRLSQYTGVFYNLNKTLPRNVLLLLYNSFILPHLILHIEVWGSSPNVHLNKLVVKQNKLLRSLLGVELVNGIPVMHTADMYRTLSILTIRNLYKMNMFRFLMMMLRGDLPYFYNALMRPLEIAHNYNTRSLAFRHPLITRETERRSIVHQLVILHEAVSPEVYRDKSLRVALTHFKKTLLESQ